MGPNEAVEPPTLWEPPPGARSSTAVGRWLDWLEAERGLVLADQHSAWEWSVRDLDGFWSSIWDHYALPARDPSSPVVADRSMPGTVWFPDARLNYAEEVLRRAPKGTAVLGRSQTRDADELSGDELADQVGRAQAGLRRLGVGVGDRVVAYLPNISEALVLLLATSGLGAIFSSCPPEFGARGVTDRFSQIEPKVLVTVDGYRHKGKAIDRSAEVATIREGLPTVQTTVLLPYLDPSARLDGAMTWSELTAEPAAVEIERVAFDHPLYVLYSSGTTGRPKPIVHGHGGILLEHIKVLHLHHDLGPGARFFWFSTTGWMMWNFLVSGLLTGASVVLYDGDPGYPDLDSLWRLAEELEVTHMGLSAPFIMACRKAELSPGKSHDLSRLSQIGSTGAPLPPEGFRWVYEHVSADVLLASISGGTDVCTAFVGASPLLPVVEGEIPCRCLGVAAYAFDDTGEVVVGEQGELVITEPMPSMPVALWGDDDGSRLRASYFERFPGLWAHGDWVTFTEGGSCVITGRSDATLNRGGVRLGSSELYSVIEDVDGVADSLVIHLEDPEGGAGELILFVVAEAGRAVDDELTARIRSELRTSLSPRHVPDTILGVSVIPRTLSGKKLEVPVKRILLGADPATAASRDALADPASLEPYAQLAAQRAQP